jgi:hypothetical protein
MYKDNSLGEESGLASSPISWCSSKGRAYKYYLQLYFTLKIDIATYYSYICILCFFFPPNTRNSEKKKKKKTESPSLQEHGACSPVRELDFNPGQFEEVGIDM